VAPYLLEANVVLLNKNVMLHSKYISLLDRENVVTDKNICG